MGLLEQYKGLSRANYILFVGRLVTCLGSMVMPMMTLLLNKKFGFSASQTAFWVIIAGLVALPANIIGGQLADRYSKKWMIILSDVVSIVLYLICGTRELNFIVFIMIIIAGFFQTLEGPAYQALVARVTPEGKQDKAFSLLYLGANLGLMLAPTIAGLLFNNYLWLCFILDGATIAISTILIFLFVDENIGKDFAPEETKVPKEAKDTDELKLKDILAANKGIILFIIAFVLYQGSYAQFSYLMPLDLTRLHGDMGPTLYGTITSFNCVLVVILTPIATKIVEAKTNEMKLAMGILMQVLGFAVFLVCLGKIPGYYIAIALFTIGEILTVLAEGPYMTINIPQEFHGRIFGVVGFADALAAGVVMYNSGWMVDYGMYHMAWIFTIVVSILALGSAAVLVMKSNRTRLQKMV